MNVYSSIEVFNTDIFYSLSNGQDIKIFKNDAKEKLLFPYFDITTNCWNCVYVDLKSSSYFELTTTPTTEVSMDLKLLVERIIFKYKNGPFIFKSTPNSLRLIADCSQSSCSSGLFVVAAMMCIASKESCSFHIIDCAEIRSNLLLIAKYPNLMKEKSSRALLLKDTITEYDASSINPENDVQDQDAEFLRSDDTLDPPFKQGHSILLPKQRQCVEFMDYMEKTQNLSVDESTYFYHVNVDIMRTYMKWTNRNNCTTRRRFFRRKICRFLRIWAIENKKSLSSNWFDAVKDEWVLMSGGDERRFNKWKESLTSRFEGSGDEMEFEKWYNHF